MTSSGWTMKAWFNAARYEAIAGQLAAQCPAFDRDRFIDLTLTGLADRELMDRLRQTAIAAHAALPGAYPEQLAVLSATAAAETEESSFVGCWYAEFVGRYGREDPARSLPALARFTRIGSAEFAIREFIERAPHATLATMTRWAHHDDEHIRRLASEGCRPRLPWGRRLPFLIKDPSPVRGILETLRDDPSLYVRKSVANHLNDISKDHPETVLAWVARWDRRSSRTAWIVRQGLRTLVKQAHPGALDLLGVGAPARLENLRFMVTPSHVTLGDTLHLDLEFTAAAGPAQEVLVDYVVHYVKARGLPQPKVFKWKQLSVPAGKSVRLHKTQQIREFTTRRHHSGVHRVEVQINGRILAESSFTLRC